MKEVIRHQNENLIALFFMMLRYLVVVILFTAVTWVARFTAGTGGPLELFNWASVVFYVMLGAIFCLDLAIHLFWRYR